MLRKFLFIGVGGSGGKTLRMIHDDLKRQLALRGHRGPLPEGWQFVQIDVPIEPDGNSPSLPPQLPAGRYLGLAPKGMAYSEIDSLLMNKGPAVQRHTGGWRPDPGRVIVNPGIGAGQYRAVGRIVAAASITQIVTQLDRAIGRLSDVSVDNEFKKIAELLGSTTTSQASDPIPVIVSSIAGGSGSGLFLDICDALRMLAPTWGDSSVGVLYTPDVFDDLSVASRAGVRPNALAALSEVMAGYWNNEAPGEDEFAILAAAGIDPRPVERRGPRYPMLVGRSNDLIRFGTQEDVFRAVAKQLTTLVVSPEVQDTASVSIFGNWGTAATSYSDTLPLAPGRGAPFSSFGFASVGLGREAFASYASERLARSTVDRLLRAHWEGNDVPTSMTSDAARDKRADQIWMRVLEDCGLNERGKQHNQILDAVVLPNREVAKTKMGDETIVAVTDRKSTVQAASLFGQINNAIVQRRGPLLDEIRRIDMANIDRWVRDIQPRVLGVVANVIAEEGLPVAVAVVERMIAELHLIVVDLQQESTSFTGQVSSLIKSAQAAITSFAATITSSDPVLRKNVDVMCDAVMSEANAENFFVIADVVDDFAANFMTPLRDAIENARQQLVSEQDGTPSHPSPYSTWPERAVPERFLPPQNEVFLDKVEDYPSIFDKYTSSTVGTDRAGDAIKTAVREVVLADTPAGPISTRTSWNPQVARFRGSSPGSKGAFNVSLGLERILDGAQDWTTRSDTAIGMYVNESLTDHLDPEKVPASELRQRMSAFEAGFTQALRTSLPLVSIDQNALRSIYPQINQVNHVRVITPIPFPVGHPARDLASDVMLKEKMDPAEIAARFGDRRTGRIDVTTFLEAPLQPMAFESITLPIRNEISSLVAQGDLSTFWANRRSRPLIYAMPISPGRRRSLMRGWFLARLLGLIDMGADRPVRVLDGDEWHSFPYPMLGSKDVTNKELLAALMESLPLALVGPVKGGPMDAYRALIDLGEPIAAATFRTSVAPPVLEQWLATGTRPAGAGDMATSLEGHQDRVARIAASRAWVSAFIAGFAELEEQSIKPDELVNASRAWEIRKEIITALEEIDALLARSTGSVISVDEIG